MRVGIAGAHGKIAREFGRLLVQRGNEAFGLIRNPAHEEELRADGVRPVIADLERIGGDELSAQLSGLDAVVFAAGAGPGSGVERKDTVDRNGSVLLAHAARLAGVRRFLQVSAIGAAKPNPPDVGEVFGAYLDAKRAAEADLRARDLDWTILRPGRLTDDSPTGRVHLAASVERDEISRADVAAMLVALLGERRSVRRALGVVRGETPIAQALEAAVAR